MLINKYKKKWELLELSKKRPKYASKIVTVDYEEFASKVEKQNDDFIDQVVNSIFNGVPTKPKCFINSLFK